MLQRLPLLLQPPQLRLRPSHHVPRGRLASLRGRHARTQRVALGRQLVDAGVGCRQAPVLVGKPRLQPHALAGRCIQPRLDRLQLRCRQPLVTQRGLQSPGGLRGGHRGRARTRRSGARGIEPCLVQPRLRRSHPCSQRDPLLFPALRLAPQLRRGLVRPCSGTVRAALRGGGCVGGAGCLRPRGGELVLQRVAFALPQVLVLLHGGGHELGLVAHAAQLVLQLLHGGVGRNQGGLPSAVGGGSGGCVATCTGAGGSLRVLVVAGRIRWAGRGDVDDAAARDLDLDGPAGQHREVGDVHRCVGHGQRRGRGTVLHRGAVHGTAAFRSCIQPCPQLLLRLYELLSLPQQLLHTPPQPRLHRHLAHRRGRR